MRSSKLILPESEIEFKKTIEVIVEFTTKAVLTKLDLLKPYLSLSEAYQAYGEGTVDRWLREDLIHKIKDGEGNSPVRISRIEIEAVAQTSNRAKWYIEFYKNKQIG
jgi:hypothetical protein